MTRQMALVGFLQAQNCTNLPGSWRHPESRDDSVVDVAVDRIGFREGVDRVLLRLQPFRTISRAAAGPTPMYS
ncbi:hypothetical protein ACVII1_004833 [Bradyrhizobium elkanii]